MGNVKTTGNKKTASTTTLAIKDSADIAVNNVIAEIKNSLDNSIPTLFDMNKLDKPYSPFPALKQNIMLERNLIEVPIATYSDRIKKNYVEFKNKDIETSVGSPKGCLRGFDEKILWGIVAYRFRKHLVNNENYSYGMWRI